MHKKTLEIIHDAYVKATQRYSSETVMDVYESLINELTHCNFSDEDAAAVDYFINGLKAGINCRLMEEDYATIMHDVSIYASCIVSYLNETYFKNSNDSKDLLFEKSIARIKSAFGSEVPKRLYYAANLVPPIIDDLYGMRFITMNRKGAINKTCVFARTFLNILCDLNRKDKNEFLKFVTESYDGSTISIIRRLLNVPFQLKEISRSDSPEEFDISKFDDGEIELPTDKDRQLLKGFVNFMKFYFDPKKNGYQSLHFVLIIPSYSDILPGGKIELQFRTDAMNYFANNRIPANHKDRVAEFRPYFVLTDEELAQTDISGFHSPLTEENDISGIYFPKKLYFRDFCSRKNRFAKYNKK